MIEYSDSGVFLPRTLGYRLNGAMKSFERAIPIGLMLLVLMQWAANPMAEAADQVTEALTMAKQKHTEAAKEISKKFSLSISEKIKNAATTGELDRVKELIALKENFEAGGGIPADPDLAEDSLRYITARKAAASQLFSAYQSAIRDYTMKLQISEATALDTELKQFVAAEKQAMQIGIPGASTTPTEDLPGRPARTKENFADWYQKYIEMMESISNEPTTVKKENTHLELAKRMDDRLKQQVWTLHCRITNVKEKNGQITIQFDPPEESPGMTEDWRCTTSTTSLKFSKQQALDLVPNDILVVTGTPRFTVTAWGFSGAAFYTRSILLAGKPISHNLVITKFRHAIKKQASSNDPAAVE